MFSSHSSSEAGHRLLERDATFTLKLVFAFTLSRLDYCNAVLAGVPQSTTAPLQRAQNAAVRVVTGIGFRENDCYPSPRAATLVVSTILHYCQTVSLCTNYTTNKNRPKKLLQMPTYVPVPDFALPVPITTKSDQILRTWSSSASQVFLMRTSCIGTLYDLHNLRK